MNLTGGSAFHSTSGGYALPFLVLFTTAAVLLKFYGSGRVKWKNKSGIKSQQKIPLVSHFPVRLPSVVEGVYTLYRFRKDGLKFWEEMQSKYGTIFNIPVAHKIFTCVFDPEAAQRILMSSDPKHLNKNNLLYDIIFAGPLKDGLLNCDYDLWSVHRKILSRGFTYNSLQIYLPIINEHGKSLVSRLRAHCTTNADNSVSGSDVDDSVWAESVRILAESMAGKEIFENGGEEEIITAEKEMMAAVQYRLEHPHLIISALWNLHPVKRKFDKYLDLTLDFLQKIIDSCKNAPPLEREESAENKESDEIGVRPFRNAMQELLYNGVSDKEILDEVTTLSMAGHETISNALRFILFHLACNPDCQQLCREEIDQFIESSGIEEANYTFTMDNIADLKYLERVVLEGMRLTPVIPIFLRYLAAPLQIDANLTLEEGSIIFFSPWCVQRNPEHFTNPTEFDPDRFLPENVRNRHHLTSMVFSKGPRQCLGYKFALLEMKIILALILRNFEVFTTDKEEDISYSIEVSLRADKEINLILKDRKVSSMNC